jgi:ribosomal protein S18 acetylase RimI-like enzyme
MLYNIRKGLKSDIPYVFELIKELALYEDSLSEVEISMEKLEKDGFGTNPLFHFFVAESDGKIIGLALFFTYYSTWKGKSVYIEDLFVKEKFRGQGIGKKLLNEVVKYSRENDFDNVIWQVLASNQSAIDFYRSVGANLDNKWINCRLNKADIKSFNL